MFAFLSEFAYRAETKPDAACEQLCCCCLGRKVAWEWGQDIGRQSMSWWFSDLPISAWFPSVSLTSYLQHSEHQLSLCSSQLGHVCPFKSEALTLMPVASLFCSPLLKFSSGLTCQITLLAYRFPPVSRVVYFHVTLIFHHILDSWLICYFSWRCRLAE